MFAFVVFLYFVFACAILWLALFSEGRTFVLRRWSSLCATLRSLTHKHPQPPSAAAYQLQRKRWFSGFIKNFVETFVHWIRTNIWLVIAGVALVCIPPVAIMLTSSGVQLDGYADGKGEENLQVVTLLQGEQLVPPAPLPPEFFLTPEIEKYRPMLITASRNWQLLDPEFTQRLLHVFKIMREQHGYEMALLEGYRSPERQDALSRVGTHVTSAKAFQSYHQYGLAADCAFLLDGKIVISEKDPWAMRGYQLYGEVAESVGFHWGGRWKMMDFGHTEWRKPGVMKR